MNHVIPYCVIFSSYQNGQQKSVLMSWFDAVRGRYHNVYQVALCETRRYQGNASVVVCVYVNVVFIGGVADWLGHTAYRWGDLSCRSGAVGHKEGS